MRATVVGRKAYRGGLGTLLGYTAVLQECFAAEQAALQVVETGLGVVLYHLHPAHGHLQPPGRTEMSAVL